eukprot:UN20323
MDPMFWGDRNTSHGTHSGVI